MLRSVIQEIADACSDLQISYQFQAGVCDIMIVPKCVNLSTTGRDSALM